MNGSKMRSSKELVLDTIETCKTTKVPVDYMPARQTDQALRQHLGFSMDRSGERDLLNYLGADIYYLSARDISQNEGYHACWNKKPDITDSERTCAFGIRWKRDAGTAKFSVDETLASPLEGVTNPQTVLDYPWPQRNDFDFSILLEEAEMYSGRAIVGGLWTGILGDAYRMVGFQDFLLSIALYPEFIHTLVNRLTDVYLELNDLYFQTMKDKMDIWFFGNDFGSQNGLLLSLDMWREYFRTPIEQLCRLAHSYGLKVMMHSCGSIAPLISDLIEVGVDVLDPVQTSAAGMKPEKLVEDYSGKITFHGGIDTQKVLPFGTGEEVQEHCKNIVSAFSSSTGYIASGSQILGPDIPLNTILTMYDQIRKINAAAK